MELCYVGAQGVIIRPGDPLYEQARQEWNRAIQKFPAVIIYCANSKEVSEAICWARKHQVEIRIRSGGHNYEGYSMGNKVVVIDISRINYMDLDERRNILKVGAGVKNTQVYNYISVLGYPFPGGTCPDVGVSGVCLGGGWGLSARYLGLCCDSLVELEMVDAEGQIITANKEKNADLFWACRGAGSGNFGVIVSMKFKLPPKVSEVIIFEMHYEEASRDTMIQFLDTWQNWIVYVDPKINGQGGIYNAVEGKYAYARGLCYGSVEETRALLAPFYEIPGGKISTKSMPFLNAINQIGLSYPPYEYFKSTGRFVENYYSYEQLGQLADFVLGERPEDSILIAVNVHGMGGKVKEVGKHDTAYYYRDANYIMSIQSVWLDNQYKETNVQWVQQRFPYIYQLTSGSYVNFPYGELSFYEEDYFGENAKGLRQVKQCYDPCNVFRFPQSIRLN